MEYSNIRFTLQTDTAFGTGIYFIPTSTGIIDNLIDITFGPIGGDSADQIATIYLDLYNQNRGVYVGNVEITSSTSAVATRNNNVVSIPWPGGIAILINFFRDNVINSNTRAFVQNLNIGSNPIGNTGRVTITEMGPVDGAALIDFLDYRLSVLQINVNDTGGTEATGSITAFGNPRNLPCLLKGTKILTPTGETLIENLQINDTVLTADGREVKIIDIVNSIVCSENNLYVIHKDKISQGVPNEDLFISGGHLVKIHDKFYHPAHDKTDLIKKCTMYKTVHFYNIKLENYLTDNLVANGVEVESLGDAENPDHTNWDCTGEDCKLLYKHQ